MEALIGKEGLDKTFQENFPETTECIHCKEEARIGFVAHELKEKENAIFVCDLHNNKKGSMWLHDACAVAVYFCKKCLKPTALYNQA